MTQKENIQLWVIFIAMYTLVVLSLYRINLDQCQSSENAHPTVISRSTFSSLVHDNNGNSVKIQPAIILACKVDGTILEIQHFDAYRVPLDLNHASFEELIEISGIGPSLAEKIIAYIDQYGPIDRFEQLRNIHGIGPKIVRTLKCATKINGI